MPAITYSLATPPLRLPEPNPMYSRAVKEAVATNPADEEAAAAEPEAAESTAESATNNNEVINIDLWHANKKRMSVSWGRYDPMRILLRALAVVWVKPCHFMILMTTGHAFEGKGCVRSYDTPSTYMRTV